MTAIFSPCGLYRLRLDRVVADTGPVVALIGVNPSSADAETNDPTITKDLGFAARLGWRRIIKVNKFAFIATDVKDLRRAADPRGPENDQYIEGAMRAADIVIPCWGPLTKLPVDLRKRWRTVCAMADRLSVELQCFGTALDGQPRHTLMLPYSTPLIKWERPR